MSDKPPDTIWLQWDDADPHEGVMWCEDRINDNDLEYVKRTPLTDAAPDMLAALTDMVEAYEYEASSENPTLMAARAAISKAEGGDDGGV